jgi:hypothetical protein
MTISKEDPRSLEEIVNDPNTDPDDFNEAARRLRVLQAMDAGK